VISCGGAPTQELAMNRQPSTIYAERICSADLFTVTAKTISFAAKRPDGTFITPGEFALCRENNDCGELPNPCPAAVNWTCNQKVCAPTCSTVQDRLVVAPAELAFSAGEGGGDPLPQTLRVSSSGASTLAWSAVCSPAWLGCEPAAGRTEGTIAVSAHPQGLAVGTHAGSIVLTVPGTTLPAVEVRAELTITREMAPPDAGGDDLGASPVDDAGADLADSGAPAEGADGSSSSRVPQKKPGAKQDACSCRATDGPAASKGGAVLALALAALAIRRRRRR
jgi:MYXO-CTERM domain-containing protein